MARRRSIYETGAYQTPLADFLDEIPDYFLKFEQLKQAEAERKEAKTFRDRQYGDAVEQQRKNNIYRQEQAEYKKVNDAYNRQSTAIERMEGVPTDIKAKMFSDLNSRPEFSALGLDNTGANNYQAQMKKLKDDYVAYVADFTDIDDLSDDEDFANYAKIETLRDTMNQNREKYSGTTWEQEYGNMTTVLSNKLSELSNKAGKSRGDVLTISDKGRVKSLRDGISKNMNQRDENDAQLTQTIASYQNAGFSMEKINDKSEVKEFISKSALYNQRIKENEAEILSIQNKPEYRYPDITTRAEADVNKELAQSQTKWVTEDATDFHKYFPDERLRLLGDEPVSAEEFEDMKARYEDAKDSEKFMAMLDEELDEDTDEPELVTEEKEIPVVEATDTREPYEIGAMEPAIEFEPGADIADADIDAVLADVRETTGFYPEGDAPREPETKPKSKPKLPSVAEPLTARSDIEKEEVVSKREKELTEATLFKEPVKVEDLKRMDINDSKGNPIKFESAKEFDKQINSMYNEIKSMDKKILRPSYYNITDKQANTLKQSQKRMTADLIKTLGILNIPTNANVKDKNLKSVMNQFLKNKKFRDSDDLINFLQKYI